jgi:hypothetical protein
MAPAEKYFTYPLIVATGTGGEGAAGPARGAGRAGW